MKKALQIMMVCFLFSGALFAQDLEKSSKISKLMKNQNGQPTFVSFQKDDTYNLQNSKQIFQDLLTKNSRVNFELLKLTNDKVGYTHQKFQQYFNGIKVEFATYTLHGKNGKLHSMSGEFYDIKEVSPPALSKAQGLDKAMAHIGASSYLWEDEAASKELDYKKPEGELVLLPMFDVQPNSRSVDRIKLAYKYEIFTIVPIGGADVYVDAHTGKILLYNARVKHYDNFGFDGRNTNTPKASTFIGSLPMETKGKTMFVAGTAATRYSGSQSIETTQSVGNYTLNDASRKVYTRNANNLAPGIFTLPYITKYSEFTDNDNNWTTAEHDNANKDNAALDAHWGAMKTYDYWNQVHGRDSYDGNGAQLRSYVHVDNNYNNAFWFRNVMSYGDGSSNGNEGNGVFDALTSIDVTAHEIGHAVTQFTADLVYQKESGGMNEGFSDIWGAAVEHFAKGNGNDAAPSADVWKIGDEIDRRSGSLGLRSMSNPKLKGQPDTYGGTNWVNVNNCTPSSDNDRCGVHTNSGVLNHWFYLLTAGGSGTNDNNDSYNVSGSGMTKAANIAYRLVSVYLSANSTYANARTFGIQSAVDLYGAGSAEEIATTNAFYAVGIGSEYVQTCALGAPANLASSNIADNSFTVSWDSVPGAVSYNVTVGSSTDTVSGTSYNATGLLSGTQYSVSVSGNCNVGGSGALSNINVTTSGSGPVIYCDSASRNTNDEFIGKVQLGSINNTTGASFYSDFTAQSTNLTKSSQYTITITPTWTGTIYNEGYSVWIDYNKDGDFIDSGEQVWTKAISKTTPVSGSFTVPSGALEVSTRMRVAMKYNRIPTSCGTFTYGEVEDYTVIIEGFGPDVTAPAITLVGDSAINLNVGETYNEQGATATDNIDGDISANVVIGGDTVNTSVEGTYVVTYNVSDTAGNAAAEVTRSVVVSVIEDNTPPVITLMGNSTINLNVGETYNEQDATATDNVDGDISANVVIGGDTVNTSVEGTYVITYNVSDAAGNAAAEVTRSVVVSVIEDNTPPVITLIGNSTINLNVGATYNEHGATATDNIDGDISANVVIGGDVIDTNTVGAYTVAYNVSDVAGNAAVEVTRTVNVSDPSTEPIVLHQGYFETSFDGWADGGNDCTRRSTSNSYEGSYSIRLRDNSGTLSSMTSPTFDLTGYNQIKVDFYFYANSMENGEDFWLRYNDGSGWTTVATYARGTDFNNNTFYSAIVTLDASQYTFASNSQFRFQCDATSIFDQVYIDQVTISGLINGSAINNTLYPLGGNNAGVAINTQATLNDTFEGDFRVFPNPASTRANISLGLDIEDKPINVVLKVYDIKGRVVKTQVWNEVSNPRFEKEINTSSLNSGLYLIGITTSNGSRETHKLIIK